jgi:short-subunit dehydrogenase
LRGDAVVLDAYADRWALITGASSGIGAEFARKLAARGMHLVLTARREDLLRELSTDLHKRHGSRCEIFAGDLSDPPFARHLLSEIKSRGITIELLVNNAGIGLVADIEHTDADRVMNMIRLNIGALTELTYLVLPEMLARQHGAIMDVASVAGFQPVAYMGAYAAGKAYVLHFSEALWAETRDRGVTVTAFCPGTTRTEFFEAAGVGGWLRKHRSQSVDQAVKAALKGLEKRRQFTVPGWRNYLLSLLVRMAPRRTVVIESMKYFRPTSRKDPSEDAG